MGDESIMDELESSESDAEERREEDEKNKELIRLVLRTEGVAECGSYGYEEVDNSYLNVTIRPNFPTSFQHSVTSPTLTDRSSLVSSDTDLSLVSTSFSSGYATN